MSEKKGRFEKGRWVEGTEIAEETEAHKVEKLAEEASRSVNKAIDDVVNLGKHLLGTPEGRSHIERRARKAGEDLEQAIREAAEAAKGAAETAKGTAGTLKEKVESARKALEKRK